MKTFKNQNKIVHFISLNGTEEGERRKILVWQIKHVEIPSLGEFSLVHFEPIRTHIDTIDQSDLTYE